MLTQVFSGVAARIGSTVIGCGIGQQLVGLAAFFNGDAIPSASLSASGTSCMIVGAALIGVGFYHAHMKNQALKQG